MVFTQIMDIWRPGRSLEDHLKQNERSYIKIHKTWILWDRFLSLMLERMCFTFYLWLPILSWSYFKVVFITGSTQCTVYEDISSTNCPFWWKNGAPHNISHFFCEMETCFLDCTWFHGHKTLSMDSNFYLDIRYDQTHSFLCILVTFIVIICHTKNSNFKKYLTS